MPSRSESLTIFSLIEWENRRVGESLQKLILIKIYPRLVDNHVQTLSHHQSTHQDTTFQKILWFFSVALMKLFQEPSERVEIQCLDNCHFPKKQTLGLLRKQIIWCDICSKRSIILKILLLNRGNTSLFWSFFPSIR